MILSLKLTHFWHIHDYSNAYMDYWFSTSRMNRTLPNELNSDDKIEKKK